MRTPVLAALALFASVAQAVPVTDTFGGTASTNQATEVYKLNTYLLASDGTLVDFEVYLDPIAVGGSWISFLVYQDVGANTWQQIYVSSPVLAGATTGFKLSPAINLPFTAGDHIAVGIYLGADSTNYYWDGTWNTLGSWGLHTGGLTTTNGTVANPPLNIVDVPTQLAYYQRVTFDPIGLADNDGDGWTFPGDCNDNNPTINPGAAEVCDGVDNDCSGAIDDEWAYPDLDYDGYGDGSGIYMDICAAPVGAVLDSSDCDDNDASIHPGAPEICDQLDNDCNNEVDEGLESNQWYLDSDGDGYAGIGATSTLTTCDPSPPAGWSDVLSDCNDADAQAFPGANERCNNLDDDCDTEVDEGLPDNTWFADFDGDGFGSQGMINTCDQSPPSGYSNNPYDCDDTNPAVNPGVIEDVCAGIDQNCDNIVPQPAEDECLEESTEKKGLLGLGCLGCATGGSPTGVLPWVMGLGLLGLRRRR